MIKELTLKNFFKSAPTVLLSFIFLSFIVDFVDKVSIFYKIEFLKLNRILKLLMVAYSVLFICFHSSYVIKKTKYVVFVFLIITILFLFKNNFWHLYLQDYLRYIYFLLIFPVVHYAFSIVRFKAIRNYFTLFKWFIILNMIAIIVGILFNIRVFETYTGARLGYNGFILSQGLAPYIYMAATVVFWIYNDKKLLFLIFILTLLSGIKGVYFGVFLLVSLLVLYSQKFSRVFKLRALVVLSILFASVIIVLFTLPTFKEVILKDGLFSAIFSYRMDAFFDILWYRTSDNFSLLFGAHGLCPVTVEMQALDLLLFFGLVGFICYVFLMVFIYKDLVKGGQTKSFFISIILLSTLSGNLFYNPIASTLFIVTLFCLNKIALNNFSLTQIEQTNQI